MTTILVYMEVPEDHKVFVFGQNVLPQKDLERLRKCHNKLVNVNMEQPLVVWLCDFVETALVKSCKVANEVPVTTADNVELIVSGFYL